ncbi:flagellar basal body protein FliL [Micromonospora sp. NPDC048930]|uniref:LppU/SCO3897 family protein n=1 Tax=Micromonospora sp. NPDC048930 TaxID=3364261 RepID=UPI0037153007
MSNFGRRDDWREPPANQRYAPTAPQYEPPAQWYEPSTGRDTGQPAHPTFPPAGPDQGGPPYPEPPRPKRGRGPLVAVLAMVVVLLLGGAAAFWLFGRDTPAPVSGPGEPTAPAVDPSAAASEPAGPAAGAPAPASSTDPRFAKAGQCVRNDGSVAEPRLVVTECAPKTYEVLRRIDGPTSGQQDAEAKCAKVAGYTDWFFFNSELDTLDFVLCLKHR